MARRGDRVECPCGVVLQLGNDRVPWHKRPNPRGGDRPPVNCHFSGVPAEGWDRVLVHEQGGVLWTLGCPACGERRGVEPSGKASFPLVCRECGALGTLQEFVEADVPRRREILRSRVTGGASTTGESPARRATGRGRW